MTTFFVKNGGSDSADGLTDGNAWATIAKVNGATLVAGDVVQFKRGSVWRETLVPKSGGSGNPITYKDYDSGNLPLIKCSDLGANWTLDAGNVWFISLATDPNEVWFDETRGTEELSKAALTASNEWFFDSGASRLYVFSTTDPDTAFTSPGIEYAVRDFAINNQNKNNVTLQNLAWRHGRGSAEGNGAVFITGSTNVTVDGCEGTECWDSAITSGSNTNLVIQNCTLSKNRLCGVNGPTASTSVTVRNNVCNENGWEHSLVYGSGILMRSRSGLIDGNICLRNGIGLSGHGTHHGIYIPGDWTGNVGSGMVISNNTVGEMPDGNGLVCAGATCVFRGNYSYGNSHSAVHCGDPTSGETGVVVYDHNILRGGHSTLGVFRIDGDSSGPLKVRMYHNTIYGETGRCCVFSTDIAEITARNNIFHNKITVVTPVSLVTQTGIFDMDYNQYYREDEIGSPASIPVGGAVRSWNTWTTVMGQEAHGVWLTSPPPGINKSKLKDPANGDFSLLSTAPAIDRGLVIQGINDGYSGAAPDLGALEFTQAAAVVSGTGATGMVEADVVAGGKTLILTLSNDTYVDAGATFNAQRQAIINGMVSGVTTQNGWNNEVRSKLTTSAVTRTSDTVVTVTLTAQADYTIPDAETVTVTLPSAALSSAGALVATPTFSISRNPPGPVNQGPPWVARPLGSQTVARQQGAAPMDAESDE